MADTSFFVADCSSRPAWDCSSSCAAQQCCDRSCSSSVPMKAMVNHPVMASVQSSGCLRCPDLLRPNLIPKVWKSHIQDGESYLRHRYAMDGLKNERSFSGQQRDSNDLRAAKYTTEEIVDHHNCRHHSSDDKCLLSFSSSNRDVAHVFQAEQGTHHSFEPD